MSCGGTCKSVLRLAVLAAIGCLAATAGERPNILWITCEDMSPHLGCWGDRYAHTPHLDRLAGQSLRCTGCFATAPVCSPSRACLINGIYATTLGTQHLRSAFPIPADFLGFPARLRAAGYYCTNNVKTDYNTSNERAILRASWDECSGKAHWRNRRPGQPFFAVFNDMVTHQSRMSVMSYKEFQQQVQSQLAPGLRHDPSKAPVPPYWPDTPITRRTVARYYDCVTVMDQHVGRLLAELDEAGVADDTIVFFYADHGSGIPRHKRLVLDSGLRVPLLVRFPGKYQKLAQAGAGEVLPRLVSFVDFAPTVLSLAGLSIPAHMQGEAFLGPASGAPRDYVYGARDRVDEAYDLARSVRDARYLYVRNYMPHLSYNQPEGYSDQAEVRREITRLAAEGKLNAAQMTYAGPRRAAEELYDCQADPDQLRNLAAAPEHAAALERLRAAHRQWVLKTRDLGFLPEWEMRRRSAGTVPYEMARDDAKYPLARILAAADLVGRPKCLARQVELLHDADGAVRYWAALGLRVLGAEAAPAQAALTAALQDSSPCVRIEAAGALVELGQSEQPIKTLCAELGCDDPDVRVRAARELQLLGTRARPALAAMQQALRNASGKKNDDGVAMYIRFALQPAVARLTASE